MNPLAVCRAVRTLPFGGSFINLGGETVKAVSIRWESAPPKAPGGPVEQRLQQRRACGDHTLLLLTVIISDLRRAALLNVYA